MTNATQVREVRRKRVQILSPFRTSAERSQAQHTEHALRLADAAVAAGVAPFPPHLLYPLFLDDLIPAERDAGIECGKAWMMAADEVWIWDLWGLSSGMRNELASLPPWGPRVLYASKGEIPAWAKIIAEAQGIEGDGT